MKIKNILFMYSTQALTRTDIYATACRELVNTNGYNVVLSYNGPTIEGIEDIKNEHFETWLEKNKDYVGESCLLDLEKKYRKSNFWQAAVIERNLTDYSFVGRAQAKSDYDIEDIEWYIKALVLYYEYIIDKYDIQAAFNVVLDNIHPVIINEMSKSMPIIPFAIGRGAYWFDDMFYLQTDPNFGSNLLTAQYNKMLEKHDKLSNMAKSKIEEYIRMISENAADTVRPAILYSKSITTTFKNAVKAAKETYRFISAKRPNVLESNFKIQFMPAVLSFLERMYNISWMRLSVTNTICPQNPYVFFPLHYQPEAAILGSSPAWRDQLALVRLLSSSLPSGFRLVVKDHPIIGGMRKPRFYKDIAELKNVVLMDDRVDSRMIINNSNCRMLVTIGGTAGLEGMLFGKPLLMFGHVYFDCMKSIIRPPENLNEMPYFMKELLIHERYKSAEEITNDAKIFLYAWLSIIKPVGQAMPEAPLNRLEAGKDWARVVHELVLQIEGSSVNA